MEVKPLADLESVIDSSRIGTFQITLIVLCALVAMIDGFDTQAIAFAAPEIVRLWHVEAHAFGGVFGAGLFGGLIGAVLFGIASDRFGRKRILIAAIFLISLGSLMTLSSRSIQALVVMRFLTGLGLGGAVPGFIALVSEYTPSRVRSMAVGLMFCGFPLGAVVGGLSAARLIPACGWESIFVVGGVFPLLVLPLFLLTVPESARFKALQEGAPAVARILRRLNTDLDWNGTVARAEDAAPARLASLFTHGRAAGTLLLWVVFFLSLLMTYFLVNWIPVVVRNAGIDLESAVVAVAMLNLGAVAGCIGIGWLAHRIGQVHAIGLAYLLGAPAIGAIGQIGHSALWLYAIAFAAGALSIGAQMCTVALCAEFYETLLRGTGIGWSIGIGRIGAIVGPVMGGFLLKLGYSAQTLFILTGAASLLAALFVFSLEWLVLKPRDAALAAADA